MSKQLYTLEYPVRCSPSILFEFLSTPAGLQEWFADKVDERDNVFFFHGMVLLKEQKYWKARTKNLFAFIGWMHPKRNILNSASKNPEITNQTILVVKDFAEKRK